MRFESGGSVLAGRYLIGARVVDDAGKSLGHVIDMEVDTANDFTVAAVELGRFGWLDRLRAIRPLAHDRLSRPLRLVVWADIDRYENGRVICKPGAQVRNELPTSDSTPQPARTSAGG